MAKPKVKVTINGKQQRQNSNHNGQKHYGDNVEIKQIMPRLVLNPFDTTGSMRQDIYIAGK